MPVLKTNRRDFLQGGGFIAAGGLVGSPWKALAAETNQQSSVPKLKITAVETAPISGARGTIDDHLRPLLIGQNPLEHRRLWRLMWGPNFGNSMAVGALDIALNDLRGKALNLPVAELFGGRLRDRVPAYASAMNYLEGFEPEELFPKEASEMVKQGFKALKMRIGRYSVGREAKVAAAIRAAVGPNIRLMADCNGAYTIATSLEIGHELHKLGFEAVEEPLP